METTRQERASRLQQAVAEEIRVQMVRRRISGVEMARRLGWSQSSFSRRLVGEQVIDLLDLELIAEALGVAIADLLPDIGGGRKDTWAYDRPGHVPVAIATVPTVPLPRGALATPPASPTRTARTGR